MPCKKRSRRRRVRGCAVDCQPVFVGQRFAVPVAAAGPEKRSQQAVSMHESAMRLPKCRPMLAFLLLLLDAGKAGLGDRSPRRASGVRPRGRGRGGTGRSCPSGALPGASGPKVLLLLLCKAARRRTEPSRPTTPNRRKAIRRLPAPPEDKSVVLIMALGCQGQTLLSILAQSLPARVPVVRAYEFLPCSAVCIVQRSVESISFSPAVPPPELSGHR